MYAHMALDQNAVPNINKYWIEALYVEGGRP